MNDAQIWTIIGALYAFLAYTLYAVRRLDRTFDRVVKRSSDPSRGPRAGQTTTEEAPRTEDQREEG